MDTTHTDSGCRVGSLSVLQLRKLKDLFRDEKAYTEFIATIRRATDPGVMSVLLDDEQPICGMISTHDAHTAMGARIVARLMDDPNTLDEIRKRLEDGRMVEYGKLE
jgi:hypothetical protein